MLIRDQSLQLDELLRAVRIAKLAGRDHQALAMSDRALMLWLDLEEAILDGREFHGQVL